MTINMRIMQTTKAENKTKNKRHATKMVPRCLRCNILGPAAIFRAFSFSHIWTLAHLLLPIYCLLAPNAQRILFCAAACVVFTFFVGTLKSISSLIFFHLFARTIFDVNHVSTRIWNHWNVNIYRVCICVCVCAWGCVVYLLLPNLNTLCNHIISLYVV